MSEQFPKTVFRGGEGEIIEIKSRFIATIIPVSTEEEAMAFVQQMKKKYWDARHNCWAYVIGERNENMRCSDDGEPAQTAGRPMLDVLLKEDIHNTVVVVTRYFGGVLLGTGGLVRAYQAAVKEGLAHCAIVEKQPGQKLTIRTDYTGLGKIEYLVREHELATLDTQYQQDVVLTILVPMELKDIIWEEITEKTSGNAELDWGDEVLYAVIDKKIEFF